MTEYLLSTDQAIFQVVNGWHPPAGIEALLIYWRTKTTWIPLYLLFAVWTTYKYRLRGLCFLLGLTAAVTLADQAAAHFLKPLIGRLRPCKLPVVPLQLRVACGSGWSFPSAHATDHFAIVGFLNFLNRGRTRPYYWLVFTWAGLVAIAQVFAGVHYPSDVLAGALLGWGIGRVIYWTYLRFQNSFTGNPFNNLHTK